MNAILQSALDDLIVLQKQKKRELAQAALLTSELDFKRRVETDSSVATRLYHFLGDPPRPLKSGRIIGQAFGTLVGFMPLTDKTVFIPGKLPTEKGMRVTYYRGLRIEGCWVWLGREWQVRWIAQVISVNRKGLEKFATIVNPDDVFNV